MESRKRPLVDGQEPITSKKRAVTSEHGSPTTTHAHNNGLVAATDPDEPREDDALENFRKEAIYRRMKHYSREHQRSQIRIADLERRRNACEAGLTAIQACWTQLIDTIRLLVNPDQLPPVSVETTDLFDLSASIDSEAAPELVEALNEKRSSTTRLVESFVQLAAQTQSALIHDEIYRKCQEAQTECNALRSEVTFIRARLADAESQRDKYHEDLLTAESRLERTRSRTANQQPSIDNSSEHLTDKATEQRAVSQAGSPKKVDADISQEDGRYRRELLAMPSTPSSPAQDRDGPYLNGNASFSHQEDSWEEIAKVRQQHIDKLQAELWLRHEDIATLRTSTKLTKTADYKTIEAYAHKLEHSDKKQQEEIARLTREVTELNARRKESEEYNNAERSKIRQEFTLMIDKRDSELIRLRDQRDQQQYELAERKSKDVVKQASLMELKALVESRSDRIAVLESELSRVKAKLAADAGDEDFMAFYLRTKGEDVSYVEDLKHRLHAAEIKLASLEETLKSLGAEHPDVERHVRSETEAKQRLAEVSEQLAKYQSVYGDSSTPDMQMLSERLKQKEEEVKVVRLQAEQQTQAEQALYAELDKLSTAWESLDRQVKSKVFDLTAMEERMTKMSLDKAKAENKYYAAMRDKEAVENERKSLVRNLEKQAKAVEKLVESEKNLIEQTEELNAKLAIDEKFYHYQKRVEDLEKEVFDLKFKLETETDRANGSANVVRDLEKTVKQERQEARNKQESWAKKTKELERQATKLREREEQISDKNYSREADLQSEVDKCMSILKCSTCRMNMRNTVITKCMHTFCKACVEARIATRQRKCPACNVPFSQSDVQQLYLQ